MTTFEPHDDNETEFDETTYVERSDVGVSITTELKRGSGTRDQDKHVIKSKAHTLEEAIEKHRAGVTYLETDVADRARAIQPDADDKEVADDG